MPSSQNEKPHHKPLGHAERTQIKRKLNIPDEAPFKKCPGKVESKLRKLAELGHPEHKDPKHAPCEDCGCDKVAGYGTNHYGYGLCYMHERSRRYRGVRDKIRDADLIAQQQRHPRHFADVNEYLESLEADAKKAAKAFDLTGELKKARNLISDVFQNFNDYEKGGKAAAKEFSAQLDEIKELLKSEREDLSEEDRTKIVSNLGFIASRLVCPYTEKGQGGPQEISFASRIKLQMEGADKLARIADTVQKLKMINVITHESFMAWLGVLYQNLKTEFGDTTYTRSDGTFQIIEGVGECMKITGNPKRGI